MKMVHQEFCNGKVPIAPTHCSIYNMCFARLHTFKIATESSNLAASESWSSLDPYIHAFVNSTVCCIKPTVCFVVLPSVDSHFYSQGVKSHQGPVQVGLAA